MPSRTVPTPRHCPIARSLDLLGDHWTLLVLREVLYGQHRFEAIFLHTGAPRDILAERLRRLLDAGMLERRPYNESQTRFEYHATRKGLAARPILMALREFGVAEIPDPQDSRIPPLSSAVDTPALDSVTSDGLPADVEDRPAG